MTSSIDGKVFKRQVTLHGIQRPVNIYIDGESKVIRFQEKGCRTAYSIPIKTVFLMAVKSGL